MPQELYDEVPTHDPRGQERLLPLLREDIRAIFPTVDFASNLVHEAIGGESSRPPIHTQAERIADTDEGFRVGEIQTEPCVSLNDPLARLDRLLGISN